MINKDGSNLVIIIGAMKSGTTSLFKFMSQHPDIISTKRTETHFFSKQFEKGLDFYNSLWPDVDPENRLYLEATPGYYKSHLHDDIPQKIYESYPKARLLFILRNPLNRLESNYRQYINDSGNKEGINNHLPEDLVQSSMYFYQVEKFLKYFTKDQIQIIKTSDLNRNPQDTLNKVCDYLNISTHNFKDLTVKYGDSRVTNTNIYQNLRKFKFLKSLVKNIPQGFKYSIIRNLSREERISNDLWKLNDTNREKLLTQFQEDNKGLIREFNIDLFEG